ncbi:MAG: hypothetical protein WC807_21925 [Hyphomicrobium sp.]|jgi:hypothetical protein
MLKHISHERLLELIHYDPETGLMKWQKPTSNRVKVGQRAGSLAAHAAYCVAANNLFGEFARAA